MTKSNWWNIERLQLNYNINISYLLEYYYRIYKYIVSNRMDIIKTKGYAYENIFSNISIYRLTYKV